MPTRCICWASSPISSGDNDIAVDLIRQAIALKPHYPEAYSNLGMALKDQGQLDAAIAAYRQAIALKPRLSRSPLAISAWP